MGIPTLKPRPSGAGFTALETPLLDSSLRRHLEEPLATVGRSIAGVGITPTMLTAAGFLIGVGGCIAVATGHWATGLVLWLLNRLADGLDGAVARNSSVGPTDLGGFYDIVADFAIYGGMVAAIGYAVPEARVAALVVFLAYYLNGTAFLAWSSLAMKRHIEGDERSLVFPAGLAEGTETIAVYSVLMLFPGWSRAILWAWAGVVTITVLQRMYLVRERLGDNSSAAAQG